MGRVAEHQDSAFIAAHVAIEAASELLRFKREGFAIGLHPFGDPEPVAQLAEALLRTARVEADLFPGRDGEDQSYREALGQLASACANFLYDQCPGSALLLAGGPMEIPESEVPY
ncbi:hypothetical protein [Novosphingobium sp. RL4]|uniref:hypothetical protein n=1 Tax=Novosphingobium sp. RL4 TaxID=3109595 RepID=UPI002D78E028|nr:hypothetical protein [Novosphingobium sp. RL4]WRT91340.1 hypothetical protein U9J33_08850 [Novosphingobium sp. RL4]